MFSKPKKVHYDSGTKPGKSSHGHRSTRSRDSGVGSSSASDRASLGTSPEQDTSFGYTDIESQRNSPRALREALRAANEKIEQLEAANTSLNTQLSESNKENRSLKRERSEFINKIDGLTDDLEAAHENIEGLKRESSPRTGGAPPVSKSAERRKTPPRREPKEADPRLYDDGRSRGSHRERRESWRELPVPLYDRPPTAPQPPPNTAPNPFMPNPNPNPNPNPSRTHAVTYAPPLSTVTYAQAPITYTTAPPGRFPNDGRYHPYPLDP